MAKREVLLRKYLEDGVEGHEVVREGRLDYRAAEQLKDGAYLKRKALQRQIVGLWMQDTESMLRDRKCTKPLS